MSDKRLVLNITSDKEFRYKPKCKNTGVNTLINMQNTDFYNAFGSEDNGALEPNTSNPISSILFASIDKTGQKYPIRAEKCVGTQNTAAEFGTGDTVITSGKILDGSLEVCCRSTTLRTSSSGLLQVGLKEFSEINESLLSAAKCEANTDEGCIHSECIPFLNNAMSVISSSLVLSSTTQDSKCNESSLTPSTSTCYPSFEQIYSNESQPSSEKLSPLILDMNSDISSTQAGKDNGILLSTPTAVNYPSFGELLAADYDITLEDLAILKAQGSENSESSLPFTILNYPSFEELYPDESEFTDEECASPLFDKNLVNEDEGAPPRKK
ncbi:uncharacterized protein LOC119689361 isoform X2 [Teleopsis dalmanni]|uniref:uncharacterized protein LOC119689361 isoform X2 n=1 Tax=Teleopsis dalmanni TaxID=139649 RepID=UPI0018CD3493|nr:uncharacterized protein LOC119689361 isoform X2 [Teleopsis dalmanni]